MRYLWVIAIVAAACIPIDEPPPTLERAPSLAPSATVLPIIPSEAPDAFVGRSEPTSAALAAEGHPSQEPELAPLATEAAIPLTVVAGDGAILRGFYYGAGSQTRPAILLLHGEDGDIDSLLRAVDALAGYNILLLNQRGYGESSGSVDWSLALNDTLAALNTLQSLPSVGRVGVMAWGRATVPALLACSQHTRCVVAAVANPAPDDALMPLEEAIANTLTLPVMTLADENGLSTAQRIESVRGDGGLQGFVTLSFDQPAIATAVVSWFNLHLPLGE